MTAILSQPQCVNHKIAPVPVEQPWRIWIKLFDTMWHHVYIHWHILKLSQNICKVLKCLFSISNMFCIPSHAPISDLMGCSFHRNHSGVTGSNMWNVWIYHTLSSLTHPPPDKMAAILADDIFNCIFLNENDRILTQISLKYVPRSPIDNKSSLVQVMAWRRTGDKPLPEPMMTQFNDAYMRH